ncbi:MAG: GAF domain-containing protein [Gemmatimonadota bacterium]|nr:MAG: GAF domain-containing protein [Gemmatimonadota bacterium]
MTLLWILVTAVAVAVGWWLGRRMAAVPSARGARGALQETRTELTRRLNELFSLQELAYVLSDSIHLDRMAEQVARYVQRFLQCDGAAVALALDAPDRLKVLSAFGILSRLEGLEASASGESGLMGAAMVKEQLQVASGEDAPPLLGSLEAERAAAVPLRAHGMTIGAVGVARHQGSDFSEEDLRLLSTVATHAAMALANAHFFSLVHSGKLQWETTFDALADGVAVVDQTGRVRRANRSLAAMLGVTLPDVIGKDLERLLFGRSPELAGLLDTARRQTRCPPLTVRSATLNRILRITASAISADVASGWVAILMEDVTEQKAFEAQLIQSEKMAAVGQLVSGVAHELNNPLTSIAGLSEFLLQRPEPSEADRGHVRVIHEQAERAARIVQDLLTFARKGPSEPAGIDLNEVTERAVSLISYEVRLRKADLEMALADKLPSVLGDRHEIQQVVLNLLTNAIHAVGEVPPGAPRLVRVSTERKRNKVVLRVADSGPGIPEELLPRIFDPFVTTKDPGKGTGLGLAISFRIAESHGGTIEVERSRWGGALFALSLPAADARATPPGVQRPDGAAQQPPAPEQPPRGRRVLLVDEDPGVRRMIGILFAQDGQEVEAAGDAAHALDLLKRHTYDLVLADPRIAVSAGESLATVLCARHPELKPRTIFITADVRSETDQWLTGLGCRYFRKPFVVRELRAAAAEILAPAQPNPTQ